MDSYSLFEKFLHHVALRWKGTRIVTFDIDSVLSRIVSQKNIPQDRHVFICGLPRSGTSILLHALYSTQLFTSLTYRNMPFVLSPYLWGKISNSHGISLDLAERAHQDGLMVGADSPESFEEVFWLTFAGDRYFRNDHLRSHDINMDTQSKFERYVTNILSCGKFGTNERYLSKNNNNLLRLPTILRAFPNARVIVPFRHPLNQAKSLLRQHKLFSDLHGYDTFARDYMGWLGHFEFGLDHRPFSFANSAPFETTHTPYSIEYWISYWIYVYQHVLSHFTSDVIFLSFEDLCKSPVNILGGLAEQLGMDSEVLVPFSQEISNASPSTVDIEVEQEMLGEALFLYDQLLNTSS